MIGLDTPKYRVGADLGGSLGASMTLSAWLKMGANFVLRVALIISADGGAGKALTPTDMLVGLMGGTDENGQPHGNEAEIRQRLADMYRRGDELRKKYPHEAARHLLSVKDGHVDVEFFARGSGTRL